MIRSRLTDKAETTLPAQVCEALDLRPGDELVYRVEAGRVILTKGAPIPGDNPFELFDEWDSEADREAYAGL